HHAHRLGVDGGLPVVGPDDPALRLGDDLGGDGTRSVWLEYSGEGSRRVYERIGFRPTGTRLYMSLEA
ncbi:hypothetical protein ACWCRI_28540, partial [Streptomyces collinus]